MKVFKFGGASVKDADGLKRVAEIVGSAKGELIVVVSAMGKTTNALEKLVPKIGAVEAEKYIGEIEDYHNALAKEVNETYRDFVNQLLHKDFSDLRKLVKDYPTENYDERYDIIVSMGEVFSTHIISGYLTGCGIANEWIDARNLIVTDNCHRDAKVNFDKTGEKIKAVKKSIIITQGFIGSSEEGYVTTLGREGSDYTAAILAYCTDAESVTIWKDVPGVLNADPKKFKETIKIDHLSYQDAIELAYYGASVIHPKTIKPLQNKNIPLFCKAIFRHFCTRYAN